MKQPIVILLWVLYLIVHIAIVTIFSSDDALGIGFFAIFIPLFYRYFLYRLFGCCQRNDASSEDQQVGTDTAQTQTETLNQPLREDAGTEASQNQPNNNNNNSEQQNNSSPPRPRRARYAFLDNAKVFLTAIVVTHHIACAFGGAGPDSVNIMIGCCGRILSQKILSIFIHLNQGYFMSLFFFMSAFFVPSSYAKGREKFLRRKWKRMLLPAIVMTFVLYPVTFLFIGRYTTGQWTYVDRPIDWGPTWYLYWLLLLNWVYMTIIESTDTSTTKYTGTTSSIAAEDGTEVEMVQVDGEEEEMKMPFPSTWTRLLCGATFAGIVLGAFIMIFPWLFATMPMAPGSFTADFLMFYAGILARKHGWLEKDLAEQLDMPLYLFFALVLVEAVSFVLLILTVVGGDLSPVLSFLTAVIMGTYCVDMSLAVLIIFQRWFNYETSLSKILARSAYCVYLIHWIVFPAVVIIFIEIYKAAFGAEDVTEDVTDGLVFGGFIFVNVVAHAILWPLSYGLTRLPYLRDVI